MNSLFSQDISRREALRLASGLGVSFLLPGLDLRAAEQRGTERPRSLITLWMAGGPSQLETWDPHPESKHGGPTRAIATTNPDLQIAHHLPQMAEQMHNLSVIRSLVSKEGDHERGTYFVQTGYRPETTVVHPSLGSILASQRPDDNVEIPMHVSLATGDGFVVPRGGYLGDEYDAFRIYDPGRNIRNMRQSVNDERQERRLTNLEVVSRTFRKGRERQVDDTLHQHVIERALTMMTSEQLKAFEIENEPKAVVDRYGDSRFGRGCLVARRLVQQGVRSIQVVLQGFDTHANNFEGHEIQCAQLDPAFAALVQDLEEHDLLQSTIVLCIGEFGRTPKINPLDGRDHWPQGFSCVVGGGGLRSGVIIGTTDPDRGAQEQNKPSTSHTGPHDPIQVPDLYATILTQMNVAPEEEIITPIGRPIALCEGTPIERLLG
ncbi:MAG: DUF1501 domain-containing protein [Planctomycetaceae bacterium]|nr:DUF1501 domain-containing protein [Planctomycetaceae bacterium]